MNPQILFYTLIGIIVVKFIFDTILNANNAKHFNDKIPEELDGIYNDEEYLKSQEYKKENYKFSLITSSFSVLLTISFFFFNPPHFPKNKTAFGSIADNKSIIVAAIALPILKLMMVIPSLVADCIGRSTPSTSTFFHFANRLTYAEKLVSRMY